MNQRNTAKRTQIIAALVEGNSIYATCRMLGVGKHTVLRLLEDAGCTCAAYHDTNVRNLRVSRAQCDEVWSFIYAKQKNVTMEQMEQGAGDCWTWTAIDADSKLIISYMLGDRGAATAHAFMHDNYCRVHSSLRVTPAMEAGLTDHVWTLAELCSLLPEKKPNARIDKELVLKALHKTA